MPNSIAPFPATRFHRTKQNAALRGLVRENHLCVDDLIWPVFVHEGQNKKEAIASMPHVFRLSIDLLLTQAKEMFDLGIDKICLFPYIEPDLKTQDCEGAWDDNNLINRAIRALKAELPEIAIMTDVALDPYNINGHDGYIVDGAIDNDKTNQALVKMALAQAKAGADIIGPSDMMDGRIALIRKALENAGYSKVAIMSYAAKYASAYYGPFRDAVGASSALKGDKKTYQMDPANSEEALRLVERDLNEGADMVIVKPGQPYLDICTKVRTRFGAPTIAYQVSGEYAMIMAASQNGWLDEDKVILESLLSFKRAGCHGILTYFAPHAAKLLAK